MGAELDRSLHTVSRRDLTQLGRYKERGAYDFPTIAGIVDAGLVCHVGLVAERQPVVLPTIYARIGKSLYIHGSAMTHWMRNLAESVPVCVTISILDGIVFARSAYQHSLNFRSVVAFGSADVVEDPTEKLAALAAIMEHVCPGRWNDVRPPVDGELDATLVLRLPLDKASAKSRSGPPVDFQRDIGKGYWAGFVPVCTVYGEPVSDPQLESGIPIPAYIRELTASGAE